MTQQQLENVYYLARRAKEQSDYATAARYYKDILYENPRDWEATFYVGLNDATSCTLAQFKIATDRIKNAFFQAFDLIDENSSGARSAVNEMVRVVLATLKNFKQTALNHYRQFSSLTNSLIEYNGHRNDVSTCAALCALHLELRAKNYEIKKKCVDLYLYAIDVQCDILSEFPRSSWSSLRTLVDDYTRKVQKYYPEYKNPIDEAIKKAPAPAAQSSSGGCYVATCVYGSYDCPQVWTLRRYRDFTLAKNIFGRAFIKTYYAVSPTLVKWFGNTQWFKKMWKAPLDKMVAGLKAKGVEDTPYKDKLW